VLLSLGRHLDTTRRLRTELTRAVAYPMMILLSIGLLMAFLGMTVFPRIIATLQGVRIETYNWSTGVRTPMNDTVPLITWLVGTSSTVLGPILMLLAIVALLVPILWQAVPGSAISQAADRLLARLPLVGPVLRKSLLSRWLDVMQVAVTAGFDLPRAIELANGAVPAPPLRADGRGLIRTLEAGRPLDAAGPLLWMPRSLPAVLEVAATTGNLPRTLGALANSEQQQADQKIAIIPAVLTPVLMTIVALLIAGVMLALLAPLSRMFQWMLF
jgi:type IV pilus assembly protein PilC